MHFVDVYAVSLQKKTTDSSLIFHPKTGLMLPLAFFLMRAKMARWQKLPAIPTYGWSIFPISLDVLLFTTQSCSKSLQGKRCSLCR